MDARERAEPVDGVMPEAMTMPAAMPTAIERCVAGFGQGLAYVVLLLSRDLVVEWVSPSVTGATGWTVDELIGADIVELVHPDDLPELASVVSDELTTPHRFDASNLGAFAVDRVRLLRNDGAWLAVEFAANNQLDNPDVDGIVVVVRDITERQLLDDVYEGMASGAMLREVADRVAQLLSCQLGGRFVQIQVAAIGEGASANAVRVVRGTARPGAVPVQRRFDDIGVVLTVHHESDAERTAWFELLLDRAGKLLRLAVVRYVGEQRLRQQAEDAEQQRRRAERLSRALDEKAAIMSAVSHDLSSPLAAIRLMSDLLDGDNDSLSDLQRKQLAQRISNDALRTTKLLTDLTSIDRLLGGAATTNRMRVSADAMLDRVLSQADAAEHLLRLAPRSPGLSCLGDPVLVERILDNLVANAVKYTPVGSMVTLGATHHPERDEVLFYVDDDGPGLPEALRDAVFDAYVRGEDTQQRPGSGIGLFLVRTFAEVQDGRAWYEPAPGGGSRFVVSLPCASDCCAGAGSAG